MVLQFMGRYFGIILQEVIYKKVVQSCSRAVVQSCSFAVSISS